MKEEQTDAIDSIDSKLLQVSINRVVGQHSPGTVRFGYKLWNA